MEGPLKLLGKYIYMYVSNTLFYSVVYLCRFQIGTILVDTHLDTHASSSQYIYQKASTKTIKKAVACVFTACILYIASATIVIIQQFHRGSAFSTT